MGAIDEAIQRARDLLATRTADAEAKKAEEEGGLGSSGKGSTTTPGAYDYGTYSGGRPPIPLSRTLITPSGTQELAINPENPIFIYEGGDGARYWDNYSQETRKRLEGQMVEAGVLSAGSYRPGGESDVQYRAWEQVLGWANHWEITPYNALARMSAEGVGRTSGGGGSGSGGGGGRSTAYTIPDYDTIAQNAKDMLRNTMGRDVDDWEISLAADELQKNYRKQASQMQAAQLAGSGEFEITDPGTVTQAFVEDQYADELSRIKDIGDEKRNYGLSMAAFTQGAKMVGG
jgi:hypothetical protein